MSARSPFVRSLYIALAALCFALGLAGVFLPLLPTTPLMLLAVALASKGSTRFALWIRANRFAGPAITAWEQEQAIPRRAKVTAVIMIVISAVVMALIIEALWLRIGLLAGLSTIALFIVTRRSPRRR
ncbi:YbaN family protein [Phytohalomonas tamaricis]|uniref:YbaN family protein n=1 Tax=Phytohalomonas tamaricis TaxID=2081032 RepID=UPI000D0B66B4|nr:YbaN family protein [Phytohalomonas tamaricis]